MCEYGAREKCLDFPKTQPQIRDSRTSPVTGVFLLLWSFSCCHGGFVHASCCRGKSTTLPLPWSSPCCLGYNWKVQSRDPVPYPCTTCSPAGLGLLGCGSLTPDVQRVRPGTQKSAFRCRCASHSHLPVTPSGLSASHPAPRAAGPLPAGSRALYTRGAVAGILLLLRCNSMWCITKYVCERAGRQHVCL